MNDADHIQWCHDRIRHLESVIDRILHTKQSGWVELQEEEILAAYKMVSSKEWALGGLYDATLFARILENKIKERNNR
jgi:hypothetical protein